MISTSSFPKALKEAVDFWVGLSYNEFPPQYSEIFKTMKSDSNFEEFVGAYGLGLAELKPEGQNISYDTMAQGPSKQVKHNTYAKAFAISKEAIRDNKYMALAEMRARAIGKSLRETKEFVAANVINRSDNASYLGADGVSLSSTAHTLARGGTFSNQFTTHSDLSELALENAILNIAGFKDEAGNKCYVRPMKLLIPNALQFDAERILKTNLRVDTADNTINALKSKGCLPGGYVVNQYLDAQDQWVILNEVDMGLIHFQREGVEVADESDFSASIYRYKGEERYSFTWGDPRLGYFSPSAS